MVIISGANKEYIFKEKSSETKIEISHLEIYNEKVFDLNSMERVDLPLRMDSQGNINVSNLRRISVKNINEFRVCYQRSRENRSTGATAINAKSSRSHSILQICVIVNNIRTKLNLIDL